eukprot:6886350-Alexandrium_andersonii.AAC.1
MAAPDSPPRGPRAASASRSAARTSRPSAERTRDGTVTSWSSLKPSSSAIVWRRPLVKSTCPSVIATSDAR